MIFNGFMAGDGLCPMEQPSLLDEISVAAPRGEALCISRTKLCWHYSQHHLVWDDNRVEATSTGVCGEYSSG